MLRDELRDVGVVTMSVSVGVFATGVIALVRPEMMGMAPVIAGGVMTVLGFAVFIMAVK
jgi:hypothetical protein